MTDPDTPKEFVEQSGLEQATGGSVTLDELRAAIADRDAGSGASPGRSTAPKSRRVTAGLLALVLVNLVCLGAAAVGGLPDAVGPPAGVTSVVGVLTLLWRRYE